MSIKFKETTFAEYLQSNKNKDLHPQTTKTFSRLPDTLLNMPNMILYGPAGTGKYTQAMKLLERYSPSGLKYEKKLSVMLPKQVYHIKMI